MQPVGVRLSVVLLTDLPVHKFPGRSDEALVLLRIQLKPLTRTEGTQIPALRADQRRLGEHQLPILVGKVPPQRRRKPPLAHHSEVAADLWVSEAGNDFGSNWATFAISQADRTRTLN